MLVDFTTSNFMSIKDEACLSLVARPSADRDDTHVVVPKLPEPSSPIRLLRTAAIYGPNAAGKTNLLMAMSAMQAMIKNSSQSMDELPVVPFEFDPACRERPSVFDVTFILEGVRYQYGFSATKSRVFGEWLFAWPRGRPQAWFERVMDNFDYGPNLPGPKRTWEAATRPDSLFLSTAVALNSKHLKPVSDWFSESLHVAAAGAWSDSFTTSLCRSGSKNDRITKNDILDFLNSADLSVKDIMVVDVEFPAEELPKALPASVREQIEKDVKGKKFPQVFFLHDVGDGDPIELDLGVESHGTQRLFALAGPWLDVLGKGATIVFDELEDSLHANLVKHLINSFHSTSINPNGAQLIFTTHNTSILNQETFRRDQVWFCERNRRFETELFPLTRFHPRKGFENLERSYLAGRYGAVPFFRDVEKGPE